MAKHYQPIDVPTGRSAVEEPVAIPSTAEVQACTTAANDGWSTQAHIVQPCPEADGVPSSHCPTLANDGVGAELKLHYPKPATAEALLHIHAVRWRQHHCGSATNERLCKFCTSVVTRRPFSSSHAGLYTVLA